MVVPMDVRTVSRVSASVYTHLVVPFYASIDIIVLLSEGFKPAKCILMGAEGKKIH